MVKNMDQGKIKPIESLKSKVKSMKRGMINGPCLEWCLEDTESEITLVLKMFDERMNNLDMNSSTMSGVVGVGITDLESFEDMWEVQLSDIAARIDVMHVFVRGRWFQLQMECVDFAEKQIPVGQFQWFIDIVSYLQFVTGETVSTAESQHD